MKKDKEFALFKRAAEEAARIDGRELMNADAAEAFEPADEAARARFEAALDSARSRRGERGGGRLIPFKWIAAAAACVIAAFFLVPASTEAGRNWLSKLALRVFPDHTEITLEDPDLEKYGNAAFYVPSRVPLEYRLRDVSADDGHFDLSYSNGRGEWFEFHLLRDPLPQGARLTEAEKLVFVPVRDAMAALTSHDGVTSIQWCNGRVNVTIEGNIPEDVLVDTARSVLPVGGDHIRYCLAGDLKGFVHSSFDLYPSADVVTDMVFTRGAHDRIRLRQLKPTATVKLDNHGAAKPVTVDIDGVEGMLIRGEETLIVWSPDNAILMLSGNIDPDELLELARSVRDQYHFLSMKDSAAD